MISHFIKGYLLLSIFCNARAEDQSLKPPVFEMRTFAAPDLSLMGLDGNEHKLSELRGKVVLLNIWGTWCSGCIQEMPSLERLTEAYKKDPDVVVILVSFNDSQRDIMTFRYKHHSNCQMFLLKNDDLPHLFQLHSFPETFLLDSKGIVQMVHTGAADWSSSTVVSLIERTKRSNKR